MIIKIQMYGCKCDNCGDKWQHSNNATIAFSDELGIKTNVEEDTEWHTEGDKHYCPTCCGGFDDQDNLILNQ